MRSRALEAGSAESPSIAWQYQRMTYDAVTIPWTDGRWTHEPEAVEITAAGRLRVTCVEQSDAWRHTSYGFVHDSEHALVRPLAVGRAVEVQFVAQFEEQFDQAGAFVLFDEEHWIKAGVEHADGVDQLGAVVTNVRSDWSVAPVPGWGGRVVTVRVSRASESVTIRAGVDDEPLRLVRVAPTPEDADAWAGPLTCAPTRAGLTVEFVSWKETDADGSLH